MADFGTILDINNTSLTLNCKNAKFNDLEPNKIVQTDVNGLLVSSNASTYFYGYFNAIITPVYVFDTIIPVNFEVQEDRGISSTGNRINILQDGIYNISISGRFNNRGGSDINIAFFQFGVYSDNSLLFNSNCPAYCKLGGSFPEGYLSSSQIVNLEQGQNVRIAFESQAEGVSLQGIDFTVGDISINYICPF